MSLKDRWDALSPNAKRASVLGVAAVSVLAIAAGSAIISPPPGSARNKKSPQESMVHNILTDTDPRSLGVEAMAARLERMERKVTALGVKEDAKEAKPPPPQPIPEEDLARKVEIEALRMEIEGLRATIDATKQDKQDRIPHPVAEPPQSVVSKLMQRPAPGKPEAPQYPPPISSDTPMEALFGPPIIAPGKLSPAPGTTAHAAGGGGNRAMTIRTVGEADQGKDSSIKTHGKEPPKDAIFVPAGSIMRGVFLNGVDMPTGQQARSQPTPALVRVKDLAILPNRVRADVRECFIIVSGYGDLASERAYLRGETFTCVRADGGVIEVPVESYAVGEDGKVGIRGRVVSKQGAMLAKALQAGFLQAFAAMFNQVPAIPVYNTNNSNSNNQQQYQSTFSGQAAASAAAHGVGSAMDRLANYYMDLAEQTFPVLEVDAGRGVEIILNAGMSLRLADFSKGAPAQHKTQQQSPASSSHKSRR